MSNHDFYKSKEWLNLLKRLKLERLNSDGKLICEFCGKEIVKSYDCIGHHKIPLNDENINLDSYLEGPTAIAFSSDDIAAIKVLSDYAKGHKVLELKAGMVEGSTCDTAKIKEFASIPGRDGLYAMLSCGMIAIVKDLSIALNLLAEQKEN